MASGAQVLTLLSCLLLVNGQQQGQNQFFYGQLCDANSQQRIASCSRELTTLGVFNNQNQGTFAVNDIRLRSRDYFLQVCNAYNRFNQCVGGGFIKQQCYGQEPIRARYAVGDAALEYMCGEGYNAMLSYWDCYLGAATRSDVTSCEQNMRQQAQFRNFETCQALKNYVECIKRPIEDTCGAASFPPVAKAIERPVQVYLPYCTLAGSTALPSFITLIAGLLLIALANKM